MFQAIYRQLRPRTFDQVIGQKAVTETLKNQIAAGRVSHAYLFCGTRGTGKTSTAKVFARALNCRNPQDGEACGVCASCLAAQDDASLDIVELDAASNNGVDDVRALRDSIAYPPQQGRFKVYIIDEVHMLSAGAFNALLKTLEEPPAHVVFILATTEPQRLPATILSRCQRFDFRRISTREIAQHLADACASVDAQGDPDALQAVARAGEGSMRDALSLLDLCIAAGQGNVTMDVVSACLGASGRDFLFEFADACARSDLAACLTGVDQLLARGRELSVFARELCEHMRALLVAATCGKDCAQLLDVSEADAQRFAEQAGAMGAPRALHAMELLAKTEADMRLSAQPRVLLELACARICRPQTDPGSREALLDRLAQLEKAVAEGAVQPRSKAAPREKPQTPAQKPDPVQPNAAAPRPAGEGALWKAALEQVKKERIRLFFSLKLASFLGIRDGVAAIAFPEDQKIHIQSLSKEENRQYFEGVLSALAGGSVRADFICGQPGPVPAAAPQMASGIEDLVKSTFGAENVQVIE